MKKIVLFICCIHFVSLANAQNNTKDTVYKIAVFAPIYLDTVFKGNTFTVTDNSLPKSILPGLDFYHGVMMAIDSLEHENIKVEVLFFDSKSRIDPLNKVFANKVWDSVSLIIASFKHRSEIKPMADFALLKKIPLINATFPNDGGVTDNPNFILLNTSLKSHCEGIYKHIQKYYSTGNLVYIMRKGNSEEEILKTFNNLSKNTPSIPLKYKVVQLTDTFTTKQLQAVLDTSKQNIVFCGTVNESFGIRVVQALQNSKKYSSVAIGMPTWDGIKGFNKTTASDEWTKGIEIIYSTPYLFSRNSFLDKKLAAQYKNKHQARGSDWFFKGYETMYYFTKTLVKYKSNFITNLSNSEFRLFNEFDIQPVFATKESTAPIYLENKKLYFIKKQDGVIKSWN